MGLADLGRKALRQRGKLTPDGLRGAKPMRNPDVVAVEAEGALTLSGPAIPKGLLGKIVSKAATEPLTKQYELEQVGSFVWGQIDGKRTFEILAKQLRDKYKMNRLEAEASLAAFLQMLAERGLITFLVKAK